MNENLKRANKLDEEINEIKDFIRIAELGKLKKSETGYLGDNNFNYLIIGAYIHEDKYNINKEKSIKEKEAINCFINNGITGLNNLLEEKEKEFENIFKK